MQVYTRGSGLIEVIVAAALLTTVFVGFFSVLQLGTKLASDNKARTTAVALMLERMEYMRSLSYSSIGVVGGIPSGNLLSNESITLNTVTYTRSTYIVYVDDPKDGLGASDSNGIIRDYKKAKVTVAWESHGKLRKIKMSSTFVSPTIEK